MAGIGLTGITGGVFMNRYTQDNNNVQNNETIINAANVASISNIWLNTNINGDIYAQTLYVDGATIGSYTGGIIIAATQTNWVYALKATDGTALWSNQYWPKWSSDPAYTVAQVTTADMIFGPSINYDAYINNNRPYISGDQGYAAGTAADIDPNIGITGTPVIDRIFGTLYFVTITKEIYNNNTPGSTDWFYQTLHCVSLLNGAHMKNSPKLIGGAKKTYSGYCTSPGVNNYTTTPGIFDTTDFSSGTPYIIRTRTTYDSPGVGITTNYLNYNTNGCNTIFFHAQLENQRPGLTLSPNRDNVYVSWAARSDIGIWHGWTIGFNSSTLNVSGVFCASQGIYGGIWMGATKAPYDSNGSLYLTTGNGIFDSNADQGCFGNAVLRMRHPTGSNLKVADYFTPSNVNDLNVNDLDVSACGVAIIHPATGSTTERVIGTGKDSTMFLMSSSNLGGFSSNGNNVLAQIYTGQSANTQSFITPAFFNNIAYQTCGGPDYLCTAILVGNASLSIIGRTSANILGHVSAPTTISASNSTEPNPLIWIATQITTGGSGTPVDSYIYVYNSNLTTLYLSIDLTATYNFKLLKFHTPTIYKGKVIMGGNGQVLMLGH